MNTLRDYIVERVKNGNIESGSGEVAEEFDNENQNINEALVTNEDLQGIIDAILETAKNNFPLVISNMTTASKKDKLFFKVYAGDQQWIELPKDKHKEFISLMQQTVKNIDERIIKNLSIDTCNKEIFRKDLSKKWSMHNLLGSKLQKDLEQINTELHESLVELMSGMSGHIAGYVPYGASTIIRDSLFPSETPINTPTGSITLAIDLDDYRTVDMNGLAVWYNPSADNKAVGELQPGLKDKYGTDIAVGDTVIYNCSYSKSGLSVSTVKGSAGKFVVLSHYYLNEFDKVLPKNMVVVKHDGNPVDLDDFVDLEN